MLRFSFEADVYEIPERGDRNPAVVLQHKVLSQFVEVTVTLMTLEEAQTDPYKLTPFFEDVIFEGTNATSESPLYIPLANVKGDSLLPTSGSK